MPREVTLNEDDIKQMEDRLKDKRETMTPPEIAFTEHLIQRGRTGLAGPKPQGGVQWTWTYRF